MTIDINCIWWHSWRVLGALHVFDLPTDMETSSICLLLQRLQHSGKHWQCSGYQVDIIFIGQYLCLSVIYIAHTAPYMEKFKRVADRISLPKTIIGWKLLSQWAPLFDPTFRIVHRQLNQMYELLKDSKTL